jgi:zinc transport system ATP-binding protein
MNAEPIVEVRGLCFSYDAQNVLKDVSFQVERGEFLGLIGPNGGGKTTVLRILLGLETDYRGIVTVFGVVPSRNHEWRRRVGVVPQVQQFPPRFPVLARDVVEMGTRARGAPNLTRVERKNRVEEALELVGATPYIDKPIYQLSGGQRQRVLIARALSGKPDLLLLDEPTVGVDAEGQDLLLQWIAKWRKQTQITVVLVTHDVGVIAPLADKLACLNIELHFHDRPDKLTGEAIQKAYGCPAELIFHSGIVPHRVVSEHRH